MTRRGSPAGGEQLLQSDPTGGFVKVAREHCGVELVAIESSLFPETGTGSGWIVRDAYVHFATWMVAEPTEKTEGGLISRPFLTPKNFQGCKNQAHEPSFSHRRLQFEPSFSPPGAWSASPARG